MTMFAQRANDNPKNRDIKVGVTYGPVSTSITEDIGHLRSFHGQLGLLLDTLEAEQAIAQETANASQPNP